MLPSELSGHSLYWSGPHLLLNIPDKWSSDISRIPVDQLSEVKLMNVVSLLVSSNNTNKCYERFSSHQRMLRVIAYMKSFLSKCRRLPVVEGILSVAELNDVPSAFILQNCSVNCHATLQFLLSSWLSCLHILTQVELSV